MSDKFCVVDTETTGLDPTVDKVIEIAVVWRKHGKLLYAHNLINPGIHIPPEVSGLHHLTDEDVKRAPSIERVVSPDNFPEGIIVAHNTRFDRQFLPQFSQRQWLCTYRCAMHIWPDAPNHKNQVLRYYLGLRLDLPDGLAPHRALYDALVTEAILQEMLKTHTIEELIILQDKPVLLKKMRFGKYKGEEWSNIPKDYLHWMLRQDDSGGIDVDVRHTIRFYLNLDHAQ